MLRVSAITHESFPSIYKEFSALVRRRIARAGIPECDLDDVMQNAWMHIWRYRAGYDPVYPVSTFIAMAADHCASRYWRDRLNKPELVHVAEDHGEDEDDSDLRQLKPFVPRTASAERGIIVRDILTKLPAANRICLELRHSGLSQDEVGRELGFAWPGKLEARAKARFRNLWKTGQLRRPHPRKGQTK